MNEIKRIAVLGSGNLGTLIFCELIKYHPNIEIYLITSHKNRFAEEIEVYTSNKCEYTVSTRNVTEDFITTADVYIFTYPKNILIPRMTEYIKKANKGSTFLFTPGTGGIDFYYSEAKKKKINFVGLSRVPYISRLKEYGKSVLNLSKRDCLYLSYLGELRVVNIFEQMDMKCKILPNYLTVTLTPSNPILHTSRLYSMSCSFPKDHEFERMILFYKEWDKKSAQILQNCDSELQKVCNSINSLDLSGVCSLMKYYESRNPDELVTKITSIESLSNIESPMIEKNNKYILDLESRYFKEDFSYGLIIIKGFAQICDIPTPNIDKILTWYGELFNITVINQGELVNTEKMNIPQNFGIKTISDIVNFYS